MYILFFIGLPYATLASRSRARLITVLFYKNKKGQINYKILRNWIGRMAKAFS